MKVPKGLEGLAGFLINGKLYKWDYGNILGRDVGRAEAVKKYCQECQGAVDFPQSDGKTVHPKVVTTDAVRKCTSKACWLYPYRTGRKSSRAVATAELLKEKR
jgi:hypothetical protein